MWQLTRRTDPPPGACDSGSTRPHTGEYLVSQEHQQIGPSRRECFARVSHVPRSSLLDDAVVLASNSAATPATPSIASSLSSSSKVWSTLVPAPPRTLAHNGGSWPVLQKIPALSAPPASNRDQPVNDRLLLLLLCRRRESLRTHEFLDGPPSSTSHADCTAVTIVGLITTVAVAAAAAAKAGAAIVDPAAGRLLLPRVQVSPSQQQQPVAAVVVQTDTDGVAVMAIISPTSTASYRLRRGMMLLRPFDCLIPLLLGSGLGYYRWPDSPDRRVPHAHC